MTAVCELRKILRAAQARQDEESLKVSAALKASTECLGVGRKQKKRPPDLAHQRIKIPNIKKKILKSAKKSPCPSASRFSSFSGIRRTTKDTNIGAIPIPFFFVRKVFVACGH
jgi:hypothetical protein